MSNSNPFEQRSREAMILELRRRYLEGTIDEVLVPDDASVDALMEDLRRHESDVPFQRHDRIRPQREEIA
jgi:hypothetical protein